MKWDEELRNDGLWRKDCREKARGAQRQRECRLCGEKRKEVMGLEQDKWWKQSSLRGTSRKSMFMSVSPPLPQINIPVPYTPLLSVKSMSRTNKMITRPISFSIHSTDGRSHLSNYEYKHYLTI